MALVGPKPGHDAYELVMVDNQPWVFTPIRRNGYMAHRMCLTDDLVAAQPGELGRPQLADQLADLRQILEVLVSDIGVDVTSMIMSSSTAGQSSRPLRRSPTRRS